MRAVLIYFLLIVLPLNCVVGSGLDCWIDAYVSSRNINDFVNCTTVHGFIEIQYSTFERTGVYNPETEKMEVVEPLKPSDLKVLKSVRKVAQYVFIQQRDSEFKNLSFLSNLEIIQGTKDYS